MMEAKERYIRVGTTLYKIVRRPLLSGDFIEERRPWNYETFRQDHSKNELAAIQKYDGFCSVPDHINYQRSIGNFLNQYEPVPHYPHKGECRTVLSFLSHIFEEQIEMGLDYIQLLYRQPLMRLPILLLVSNERNTGKSTFLNFLKAIFAGNMTFNTNEDFRSQFNADWANKLIVAVDEVLLDRREDSERIKNLSTAMSYKAEAKFKDRSEVEFFAKFILSSNNEVCPVIIEQAETRYWVRKIRPLKKEISQMLSMLKAEIPQFLYFLMQRQTSTSHESRMWFRHDLLETDALKKIRQYNRGRIETEMLQIITDIVQIKDLEQFSFCVGDMVAMLNNRSVKCEPSSVRQILQGRWNLAPSPEPIHSTTYSIDFNGDVFENYKTGRFYRISRSRLEEIL
jgi:Predicted ATPase